MFEIILTLSLGALSSAQGIETAGPRLYQITPQSPETPGSVLNQHGALEEMHYHFLKDFQQHQELDPKLACKVSLYFQEASNCPRTTVNLDRIQRQWPEGTEVFIETERVQEGHPVASQSDYSWTVFPPSQPPVKFYGRYEEFTLIKNSPRAEQIHKAPSPAYWKWALAFVAVGFAAQELSHKKIIIHKTW